LVVFVVVRERLGVWCFGGEGGEELRRESQIALFVFDHQSEKPCCWQLAVTSISMVPLRLD
jgi:hypothetical protein